jgi:hypothetical protein
MLIEIINRTLVSVTQHDSMLSYALFLIKFSNAILIEIMNRRWVSVTGNKRQHAELDGYLVNIRKVR